MCICVFLCCLKSFSSHNFWEYLIQDFITNLLKLPLSRKSVAIVLQNPIPELMLFGQLASLTLFDAIMAFVYCFSLEKTLYTTPLISSSGLHHRLLFFTLPGNGKNKIFFLNKIFSLIFPFWLNMEMIENTAQSFPITSHAKILISCFVIFLFPFFLKLLINYCASHASANTLLVG